MHIRSCFDADPDPAQNLDPDPDPAGGGVGQPKMCIPPGKILGTPLVSCVLNRRNERQKVTFIQGTRRSVYTEQR
jgi:hypothetical protein